MPGETIDQFDGHEDRVSRFIEQWRNKPDLEALARIYLRQVQDLEDVLFEIILERNIDDSIGVQLNIIGRLVGQARTSDDERFRTAVRARIAINLSDSTPEDIIKVARLLLADGEAFELIEEPPAQLRVTVVDPLTSGDPDLIRFLLKSAAGAGVRLVFNYTSNIVEADAFTFSDVDGAATVGKGFADTGGGGVDEGALASSEA